jgi:hypothetical protein
VLTSWLRTSSIGWRYSMPGQFNIANSIELTASLIVE